MDDQVVSLRVDQHRSEAVIAIERFDRSALPVVDRDGVLVGIVTFDDVADVAKAEVTEDIQKMGGLEALDEPYMSMSLLRLVRKRGTWLSALFLGEMLTATAMGYFQVEIEKASVLALFMPLIISSGGNSGSQGSTLVIRAMALGEVKVKDWFKVFRREISCGLLLGLLLGVLGLARIHIWQAVGWQDYTVHTHEHNTYKLAPDAKVVFDGAEHSVGPGQELTIKEGEPHGKGELAERDVTEIHIGEPTKQSAAHSVLTASYHLVAMTVGVALIGVVLWGTLMGSMLPFLLRRLKLDPATISAPLVATLVDVTGLIIYFTTAMAILHSVLG